MAVPAITTYCAETALCPTPRVDWNLPRGADRAMAKPKKPFVKPVLIDEGTLADVTLQSGGLLTLEDVILPSGGLLT